MATNNKDLKKPSQFTKSKVLKSPSMFTGEIKKVVSSNKIAAESVFQADDLKLLSPVAFISQQNKNTENKGKTKNIANQIEYKSLSNRNSSVCTKSLVQIKQDEGKFSFLLEEQKPKQDENSIITSQQSQVLELNKKIKSVRDEMIVLKGEIESCHHQISCLQHENLMLKEKHETCEHNHFVEMKRMYENYIVTQNQTEKEKKKTKNEIDVLTSGYEKQLEENAKSLLELRDNVELLKSENENLLQKNNELKSTVHTLNCECEQNKIKVTNTEQEKYELSNRCEHLLAEMNALKTNFADQTLCIQEKESLLNKQNVEIKANNDLMMAESLELNRKIEALLLEVASEKSKTQSLQSILEDQSYKLKISSEQIDNNHNTEVVNKMNSQISEKNNKILSLEKRLLEKEKEIEELNETYISLQKTNKLLHIRYDTLHEMQNLQNKTELTSGNDNEQLLNLWRRKVYQMLVLWKTHESQCTFKY